MNRPFSETLAAAKSGEAWAWEQIYRTLAPPVTGYLAVRGAKEPEDVASETLYHVARSIEKFEGSEESFRSWVFVIAHRKLIDARRSAQRSVDQAQLNGDYTDSKNSSETEALNRVALEEMTSLIADLTSDQQEVIVLRMVADLSLAETAKVMGKNIGSIKALQRRALENLRKAIEVEGVSR